VTGKRLVLLQNILEELVNTKEKEQWAYQWEGLDDRRNPRRPATDV